MSEHPSGRIRLLHELLRRYSYRKITSLPRPIGNHLYGLNYNFYRFSPPEIGFYRYLCNMDEIIKLPTVKDYDDYWGVPTRHPLVNVIEGSRVTRHIPNCRKNMDLYVIFLKDVMCADYITYGRQEYDYQENTLVFIARAAR